MGKTIWRVGTTYLPVQNVEESTIWYETKLGAIVTYKDTEKAIINFANQSFFLVKASENATANFIDGAGNTHFSLTFEVDGVDALEDLHRQFNKNDIKVGAIEDRGHPGKNFIFYDPSGNIFDVWSELSPDFKNRYTI
ncbi:VOC family protein [Oceanobacillus kapialis]|uniref:VOC family protein n=1 Tax=Oceanobacillus kapialis TaxID=481353 RepID=UPI0038514313